MGAGCVERGDGQRRPVGGGGRAPFPCSPTASPFYPSASTFAGHSGSSQGQLKLTAIYCISIMVSHLPPPWGPFPPSRCAAADLPPPPPPGPVIPSTLSRPLSLRLRVRATRGDRWLHSRFTASFMVHTVREHAEVPYGYLPPRASNMERRLLFPVNYLGPGSYALTRVYACARTRARAARRTLRSPEARSRVVRKSMNGRGRPIGPCPWNRA